MDQQCLDGIGKFIQLTGSNSVEFKVVKDQLEAEVSNLRGAAECLSTDGNISSDGVSTLRTCMRYIRQQGEIAELMKKYRQLVEKDCQDISEMIRFSAQVDNDIAQSVKTLE